MSSKRNFISITNKYDRVVLLVDMDCFYCQVEEKLDPTLAGKPIAVVQYNAWRGGGIIAVNYAARAKGVTRHMRGDEAKEQCPDIVLVKVPNIREKADLTKYRDAGKEVAHVLQRFTSLLERASVDEAYLDITAEVNKRMESMNDGTFFLEPEKLANTYVVGYDSLGKYIVEITSKITEPCNDEELSLYCDEDDAPAVRKSNLKLLLGAAIASEIRAAVKKETSYECSAGIAHNKILAKLACGMNKPNKQTVLPLSQINPLFRTLPVNKIKGLGAKFGEEICERLNIKFLGDLLNFSEVELQKKLDEKNGSWMYLVCRGIDLEAVTPRFYSKSIGCCKKFPGRNSITGLKTLQHWLSELASEIADRLEKDVEENNRRAKQMVVSYTQEIESEDISSSRSSALTNYDPVSIQKIALDILKRNTNQFFKTGSELALNNPIKFLGISVGKFESINSDTQNTLQQMFANQKKKENPTSIDSTKKEDKVISIAVEKANVLEKLFAHQRTKESQKSSQSTCQQKMGSLASKSFFATHLNQVKEEKQDDDTQFMSNDLCGKKIVSEAAELDFFSSRSSAEALESTRASTSFFGNPLRPHSPVKKHITLKRKQDPLDTSVSLSENTCKISCVEHTISESQANSDSFSEPIPTAFETDSKSNFAIDEPSTLNAKPESTATPNTSAENTFMSSYVELATPELKDEFFTKCEICGQKILCDEKSLQSHQDRHIAEELSRQQREEYRKEMNLKLSQTAVKQKIKPASSQNANKKLKTNSAIAASDITKFMAPLTQNDGPSTSTQVICAKCGRAMHRDLMPEHLDYHFARDLQINLNKSEMTTIVRKGAQQSPSVVKKNNSSNVSETKSKPISQFFTHL